MAIKALPENEQPRQKALLYGIECLSNQELLALLLRSGSKKESVLQIAGRVLEKSNGMENFMNLQLSDLMEIDGVKSAKALTVLAVIELIKRIRDTPIMKGQRIDSTHKAYSYVRSKLEYENQEKVLVLYLNSKSELIKEKILFTGTLSASIISPKEIMKEALLCNCRSILLFHNHPSGNSHPSEDDVNITYKVLSAAYCFDIVLIDHIIIGKNEYYSMKEHDIF